MNIKKFTNEKLLTLILYIKDLILNSSNLDNGLILTTEKKIDDDGDFIREPGRVGFVPKIIVKDDGDFKEFEPAGEQQNIGSEKMHCASESGCNVIETLINYFIYLVKAGKADQNQRNIVEIFRQFSFIQEVNGVEKCLVSTRYVAAGSGTTIRGNTQKAVADFIRHYGLVPKKDYPYLEDWNEYYYPENGVLINGNKVPQNLLDSGMKFAEYIEFNYEWVSTSNIIDTYKYGCQQNVGYAWGENNNGIYIRTTKQSNHAFMGNGKQLDYQQVFDSYYPFDKKVALNFYKDYSMLYTIGTKKSIFSFNLNYLETLIRRGLQYVLLVNRFGEYEAGVYKLYKDRIEKAELKVILDAGVVGLAEDKKLTGISIDDFKKIINQ